MNGLDLQAVVPTLHGRIVVTVTLLNSAGDEVMGLQEAPIVMRAVLAAAVRVEDNTAGRLRRQSAMRKASQVSFAVIRSDIAQPTTLRV